MGIGRAEAARPWRATGALLVLLVTWVSLACMTVVGLRGTGREGRGWLRLLRAARALLRFAYDFVVVGDDWRIGAGVLVVLAAGAVLVAGRVVADTVLAPLVGVALTGVLAVSVLREVRGRG